MSFNFISVCPDLFRPYLSLHSPSLGRRYGNYLEGGFVTLLPREGTPLSIGGVGPGCLLDPTLQHNTMKRPSKYILMILSRHAMQQFSRQVSDQYSMSAV